LSETDPETALTAAWAAWCDGLRRAGEQVLTSEHTLSDKAEGLRWLTRLTRFGLEAGLEFSDPQFPEFYKPTHETVKVMSDNPDAVHWMATIRADGEYILHGTRGDNPRIMFTTLARSESGGMTQQTGLDTNALAVEADGSFRIHVSRHPRETNWLELKDGAQSLLVRALFFDRKTEKPPTVWLEEIGGPATPPPLDAATMATRLDFARMIGLGSSKTILRYADELRERGWINRFGENPDSWGAGDPGVHYLHGAWQLAPDEALMIDLEPADCFFWNLQINNRWAESLDYLHRRVHINSHGAAPGPDGKVRVVVAAADPAISGLTWLDTEGHGKGTMLIRSIDARSSARANTRVVPVAALKDL
jgi:hypothetical protein